MQKKEKPVYKRIVLKLSGEALQGKRGYAIDTEATQSVAEQIKEVNSLGVEVAIVIGGGNIFRGLAASSQGMDRSVADYMGMLATVINSLALQDALEKLGVATRVLSAIAMEKVAEPYIKRRAIRHLEKGRVTILAGGTGNPYFSTDTAAALRAAEIGAQGILKATKVDGVYTADPLKDKTAKKFDQLSYIDVIKMRLGIMDATAVTLCRENNLPIIVFNLTKKGNIKKVLLGKKIGTLVR